MRQSRVLALLFAFCFPAIARADEYPRPTGFVNDLANQLPLAAVQALEKKVRGYERATGNEIAVAVVPSLNGMTVDEYAQGLFRAWGVGKYGVNNGVLLLWAPAERKVRIHVGRGVEGVLTNAAAGRIVLRITGLFKRDQYVEGVNAGVDGIIEVLGASETPAEGSNFVDRNSPAELERQRQEAARRQQAEDEARAASRRTMMIGLAAVGALGVVLCLLYRRSRAARWREELPRAFADAEQSLAEAERKRAEAQVALTELRKEAPEEVWRGYEAALNGAPDALGRQRSGLDTLLRQPRQTYGELHAVHKGLREWQGRLTHVVRTVGEATGMLVTFRVRRTEAQQMLQTVPSTLVRLEAQGVPGGTEGLLRAAGETYRQALQESSKSPANWLLVYDLLADVQGCLEQIENPSRARYQPVRYWGGYESSPASDALAVMWIASEQSRSVSSGGGWSDAGGGGGDSSGGGGDSGGFGGGDSGGGGSSSDY